MKHLSLVASLLFSATLTATDAHAVIIEGFFQGTVRTFTNGDADIDYTGYWDGISEGSEASGSFWYDTEKAPGNTSDFTTSSFYQSYTDRWMESNFYINDKTYNISDLPLLEDGGILSEGVWLHNFEPSIDDSTREMFYLFDNISNGRSGNYRSIGLVVEIASLEETLLDGLGLIQEFDWYDIDDPTSYGQAYISMSVANSNERKFSDAWIDISEFHIRVKNTASVPEPSPLLLLCMGVFALVIRRERSKLMQNKSII